MVKTPAPPYFQHSKSNYARKSGVSLADGGKLLNLKGLLWEAILQVEVL